MDTFALGSPLGPVLADIIMIKLESTIVKELVDKSLVKLYMRYVDNTLLLVKDKDVNYIHKRLNSFDKNIQFTVDTFPDSIVNFLDIKVDKNHTDIYSYMAIHKLPQSYTLPFKNCMDKSIISSC